MISVVIHFLWHGSSRISMYLNSFSPFSPLYLYAHSPKAIWHAMYIDLENMGRGGKGEHDQKRKFQRRRLIQNSSKIYWLFPFLLFFSISFKKF